METTAGRDAVRSPRRRRGSARPRRRPRAASIPPGLLQRQAEQVRGIEPVHRGPAVRAVAEVAGNPLSRAMATRVAMKPLSPSRDWSGKPTTDERTPREAKERVSSRWPAGSPDRCPRPRCPSRHRARPARLPAALVRPRRPGGDEERRSNPRAPREGLDGAAVGIGSALEVPRKAMSCLNARWITPSEAAAALRRPSRSSRVPRCTCAPAAASAAAAASERASPVT